MCAVIVAIMLFYFLDKYDPYIDILNNGDIVLWYNVKEKDKTMRKFKFLRKHEPE